MLRRVLALLRSPVLRVGFLLVALGLATWYVVRERDEIAQAWAQLSPGAVLLALLLSVANVALAGASWRAVMADLGSPLRARDAAKVFFVGQLGRYIPGSVFQFVAQAELARDLGVPRRRTGSALAVALLVSMTTCALLLTGLLPLGLQGVDLQGLGWSRHLAWLTPVFLLLLVPAVLNPLLRKLLQVARQEPLEHPVSARGLLAAAGWALASWVAVGLQVFVLASSLGSGLSTGHLLALCLGGYCLAWLVGFLVIIAPAGAGAREVVLAAVVAVAVGGGGSALVVLGSRVLLTLADLVLALVSLSAARRAPRAGSADRD